jgi:hypothetical protein
VTGLCKLTVYIFKNGMDAMNNPRRSSLPLFALKTPLGSLKTFASEPILRFIPVHANNKNKK